MPDERTSSAARLELVFPGDGEMARRMRAFDWAKTAAGPVETWPESLKTAVRLVLSSRFPMFIWWGPATLTYLYNDAYIPVLGAKHPAALGRSGAAMWTEIWDTLGPFTDAVFRECRASWSEELPLTMERHGYREETFFTFSYSPILEADGRVGGLFCACTEDTRRVVSERRLKTQREVAGEVAASQSIDEACSKAATHLATNPHDLPFVLLYLLDDEGTRARLTATTGSSGTSRPAAEDVLLGADEDVWDFATVARTRASRFTDTVPRAFTGAVPHGFWDEPPNQALVVPLVRPGHDVLSGFAVFGLSPRRAFDDDYRGFCELVAAHIATGIVNARAYDEERRRAESLAELDRAKTAFFSNVSHEFRTPLTLMLGPLEDVLAEGDGALEARTRDQLDVAHRNSLRLLKLVNTLLDFSRIEAGRMEATYEETDVCAFTEELASVFRSAVERARLSLEVFCGPVTAPVWVDREMWEKIVLNLLSNAFKFTPSGGIFVTVEERGKHVVLSVRDTGIGIPSDEVPHVFERFHRVRGAQGRTHEGTGIGLALVQELVKLHGGTVSVESTLGEGTTFTVSVPTGSTHLPADRIDAVRTLTSTALGAAPWVEEALRWLPDEARADRSAGETEARGAAVSTAGAHVLLADDNQDMREYLRRLLSTHWTVEAVSDGEAAVEAVERFRPDLVLTDVMMPKRDGFSVLAAVRANPATRTLPVILLSARAGEEARVEGLGAGADDYLIKPFAARELIARVNTHLELARIRREAYAQVAESEERYRSLVDATTSVVWRAGSDGGLLDSPRGSDIIDLTHEEMKGWGWLDAVHPDDRENTELVWRRAVVAKSAVSAEHRLRTRSGEYRWMAARGVPVYAPDGSVREWVGTVIDIHDRKRAEEEREALISVAEQARREAESANQAKDDFLAVLSHELRSPMNAMLGWIRILQAAGPKDPDLVARAVRTLERNISVQAQVINDLLDVSRIMSGKLELDRERLDFDSLVTASVESLRPAAEGKQIALRLVVRHDDTEVVGDAARLQQVVTNLIGNAIKFTNEGGFITVTVDRSTTWATMTVDDTGQGIPSEFLPHLFERFRQADSSATRRHGGLGLGLSIVKNLVALHGGEVTAESAGPGRGARFQVSLPLAGVRSVVAFRPAAAAPLEEDLTLPEGLDVLLVEDDDDTRGAITMMLETSGARVRSAASVRQALDSYGTRRPDVIISDIGMPGEDGYVLIRAVREREDGRSHRTLAIAMTGFASRQDHEMALRAGFDEHVAKPVEPTQIIERMRVLASSRRSRTSWR
jgi:PAS domain S-box-containing protein